MQCQNTTSLIERGWAITLYRGPLLVGVPRYQPLPGPEIYGGSPVRSGIDNAPWSNGGDQTGFT